MPRKPSKKTLKNKLDAIFSKVIRSLGHCEKCGETSNLQCAHIYSRRFLNTRWDLENALCLCYKCHTWGHQRPLDFAKWVEEYIGGDIAGTLRERSKVLTRGGFDYQGKYDELKEILDKMQ